MSVGKDMGKRGKQEGVRAGLGSQNLPGVKSSCSHSQGSWQPRLQPRGHCCTPEPSPRDSSTPHPSPSQVRSPVPSPRFPCSSHHGIPHLHHLFHELCLVIPTLGTASKDSPLSPLCACTWAGVALPRSPHDTFLSEPPSAPRAQQQLCGELEPCVGLGLNALSCVLGKCCPEAEGTGMSGHRQVRMRVAHHCPVLAPESSLVSKLHTFKVM